MNAKSYSSRRPRILHFVESGGVYGAERVILNLSEATRERGTYEPVVGCISQDEGQRPDLAVVAQKAGIASEGLIIRNSMIFVDLPRAVRRIRTMGIDLIHSHGYKPSVFAFLIGKLAHIPVMATCHLWYVDGTAPLRTRALIALEKRLYRSFPTVVAVSENIRAILLENGVPPSRTTVIPNGIPIAKFDEGVLKAGTQITKGPLRDDKSLFLVMNVARLTAQKAQSDIITAAAELRDKIPGLRVLIVGEGELRSALERQIGELKLGETVHLLGFRDDVPALLRTADVFVLPSRDEGLPMSLLEAVACNVPVIVTPVGDIPKLIRNGETGIMIQPDRPDQLSAAIMRLYEKADDRKSLARQASEHLRASYSCEQMYAEYDDVYRRLLAS